MVQKDCSHKLRHDNLNAATKHADSLMGRLAMARAPIVAYYCDRHACYHCGHNTRIPADVARTVTAASWHRARLAREIEKLSSECALLAMLETIYNEFE